ncbi:hypothetical protein VULLAG_LOCUS22421 [Vulpes lagopus]
MRKVPALDACPCPPSQAELPQGSAVPGRRRAGPVPFPPTQAVGEGAREPGQGAGPVHRVDLGAAGGRKGEQGTAKGGEQYSGGTVAPGVLPLEDTGSTRHRPFAVGEDPRRPELPPPGDSPAHGTRRGPRPPAQPEGRGHPRCPDGGSGYWLASLSLAVAAKQDCAVDLRAERRAGGALSRDPRRPARPGPPASERQRAHDQDPRSAGLQAQDKSQNDKAK